MPNCFFVSFKDLLIYLMLSDFYLLLIMYQVLYSSSFKWLKNNINLAFLKIIDK